MENDIEIQCPGCKAFYTIPIQLLGDSGTCAACGTEFKVERYAPKFSTAGPFVRGLRWILGLLRKVNHGKSETVGVC